MEVRTRWRWVGTAIGTVGGFILGYAIVTTSGIRGPGSQVIFALTTLEGLIFAYLGTPYVLGGWRSMNMRLTTTPLTDLIAGLFGMIVGLVVAVLIGYFVRAFPYGVALSAVLAALLGFMGARVGMTRRAELLALVGISRQDSPGSRHIRAALLDTSVIIDGRILDLVRTGFLDIPLVVPRSVLRELQHVADAADPVRRARGRRGLDVLTELQREPAASLEFLDDDGSPEVETDGLLVRLAKRQGWAIMTNDFNLNRVANLEGVSVLNLNELSNALKPIAIPGEELTVLVVKDGREPGQGVGYLDDGTMVVIEHGHRYLNQSVTTVVTSVLQTAAGRMIFATPSTGASAATEQPDGPEGGSPANGRRKQRRQAE
jgi:uncharacterized protein YacL